MANASSKILRVALVQGSKITEERHFRKRHDISIGHDAKNTFVLPDPAVPKSFCIFEHKGDQFSLVFSEAMDGRVWMDSAHLDFAAIKSRGFAQKRGEVYVLPLPETARGTVRLGESTLLFQFSTPTSALLELPKEMRGTPWRTMDRFFFGVLVASLALHFAGAICIAVTPKPLDRELSLDELPDRFAKVLIPVKQPEQMHRARVEKAARARPEEAAKREATPKEAAEAPKMASARPAAGTSSAAAQKAVMVQKVAGKGLLKILGSSAAGGPGALEDVLGSSTGTGDVARALAGAAGVGVATSEALAAGSQRGGGTGKVAAIGELGTSGGGPVSLGNKGDARVVGRVQDIAPEVESAEVDREALARYVKMRLKAIQGCYEKELKRNPTLKGKVVVRFAITHSGRANDIEIEENSLGSEPVSSCIKTVIRGWIFPFKPEGDVPVAYPFLFSPTT